MLSILSSFDSLVFLFLFLFLISLILFFEAINGFHDTANAIATVIYTNAMRPVYAVILSGIFNFVGVITGGLAVAYSIIYLLPIELLHLGVNYELIAMIFAIIIGAIIWNLGTWYFGIPASSTHTLIGAIIGAGIMHAFIGHASLTQGINWGKAVDIMLSLFFSPIMGFLLAFLFLKILLRIFPKANIHQSPNVRIGVLGKKHPPFWTRFYIILSSIGVSFTHGSNDGQKGVGLFMLTLICFLPGTLLLNSHADKYEIEKTVSVVGQLSTYISENNLILNKKINTNVKSEICKVHTPQEMVANITNKLKASNFNLNALDSNSKFEVRQQIICLSNIAKKLSTDKSLSESDRNYLKKLKHNMTGLVEYAPSWVIIAVALAISIGTLVGWKRVVQTVGESISKSGLTYSQGVSAQIVTSFSILGANLWGLPVSTTQILSSAVAGSSIANNSGLRWVTIRNILLTWAFTLPVSIMVSAVLYAIIHYLFL